MLLRSQAFARAAALTDDFDLFRVARAIVANQLESAFLGALRPTTVCAAVSAAY